MIKKVALVLFALIVTASWQNSFAFAASDKLPEPMVGQTEVKQTIGGTDITYYGGVAGNETVLNYEQSGKEVTDVTTDKNGGLFGFDQANLMRCLGGIIVGETLNSCFIKNISTNSVDLMTSRTYFNSLPATEIATLIYPSVTIIGDSNLGGSNLGDFNYWGRHLTITNGAADSDETYWGIGGYTMNPEAQATLDTSSDTYNNYMAKIDTLRGEATTANVSTLGSSNWYLQGNSSITDINTSDSAKYPEGKVWADNSSYPAIGSKTYSGIGTIVIGDKEHNNTNLIIKAGTVLKPPLGDNNSRLGIIVYGNVTVSKNCDIQASIFATGTIKMNGDNTTMTGSFVATNFTGLSGTGSHNNLRFSYDYNLSNVWPPGFRYLNMPHPTK